MYQKRNENEIVTPIELGWVVSTSEKLQAMEGNMHLVFFISAVRNSYYQMVLTASQSFLVTRKLTFSGLSLCNSIILRERKKTGSYTAVINTLIK